MRQWLLGFLFALALFHPVAAHAEAGAWQRAEGASVRLLSGVNGVGAASEIPLGLEIALDADWHTYWRSPGEAGLPPRFDWQNSLNDAGNLQSAALLYPAPRRYTAYGMETIGYREHVLLPITAQLRVAGQPLIIDATLNLLICSDICVPRSYPLKLTVPAGEATPSAEAALIDAARATVPDSAQKAGITVAAATRNADTIAITLYGQKEFTAPDAFIENDQSVFFAKPHISTDSDKPTATVTFKLSDPLPQGVTLATLPFTLTFIDNDRAFEQSFTPETPQPAPQPPAQTAPTQSLWAIVILAVIGGFILNLMPCVLPVLSLKLLNVVSHGGGAKHRVRRSFLMTAAGIMFSFLLLAGITAALKETGHAIGWGVQFQQPLFLVLLIVLLTLFAANLWEQFAIPLPRFLIDRIDPHYHPKLAGDFATGAFATLLATPCTAPFLGTAVGFALARGFSEIFAIFAALGFGMALPYLAIALWPRLATTLPKPGLWMLTLRRALGVALILTAVWLLWVLTAEMTPQGVGAIGASMAAILALIHLRRRRQRFRSVFPWLLGLFILLPFIASLLSAAPSVTPALEGAWRPFEEEAIGRHVAEGKTVFVDVTADWCLTCKANKRFTLNREDIAARLFQDPNVIAMQADWTNPDPIIAAFLQRHHRYGIPFNIVFGPAAPEGMVLAELLSPSMVREALDKARGKP